MALVSLGFRMKRFLLGSFGLLLGLPVLAQETTPESQSTPATQPETEKTFRIGINYRLWMLGFTPYPIEPSGLTLDETTFVEHRLRVTPSWRLTPRFRLDGSADLLTGLIVGQTTDDIFAAAEPRNELNGFSTARIRQLSAEYRAFGEVERPAFILRAGLQNNQIGLGILGNDGNKDDQDWGLQRFGDEAIRFLVGSRPIAVATKGQKGLPWQVGLVADLVRKDASANLANGDIAIQGLAAVQYITTPLEAGFVFTKRNQIAPPDEGETILDEAGNPTQETLNVNVFDLYFMFHKDLGESNLSLAGEGVVVTGDTTLTRSEDLPGGTLIQQGGGVLRASLTKNRTTGELEGGFASGDSNPQDGTTTNFAFNRDYNVSLLLFEEVLASQTARDGSRAQDPNTSAVPRDGVERIATNGAVSGAAYAKITGRFEPNPNTKIVGKLLYAHETSDVVAPFASFENGGVFANYVGGDAAKRSLGIEGDLGVFYGLQAGRVPLRFSFVGGVFLPGNAFEDAEGVRMAPVLSLQSGVSVPFDLLP